MNKELVSHETGFEEAASILSSLAIEGIFLPSNTLKEMLMKDFGLSPKLTENLVNIFGKNGSKNGNER